LWLLRLCAEKKNIFSAQRRRVYKAAKMIDKINNQTPIYQKKIVSLHDFFLISKKWKEKQKWRRE